MPIETSGLEFEECNLIFLGRRRGGSSAFSVKASLIWGVVESQPFVLG